MGMPRRPLQNRSLETKRKILEAGKDLFFQNGYENVRAVDIARASGTAVGSFYSYFRNKHDLLITLAEEYYETTRNGEYNLLKSLQERESRNDAKTFIKDFLLISLENHKNNAEIVKELIRLSPHDAVIAEMLTSLDRDICLMLGGVLHSVSKMPDDRASRTASVIYVASEGVIHSLAFEPGKLDEKTAIETLTIMISRLISKHEI